MCHRNNCRQPHADISYNPIRAIDYVKGGLGHVSAPFEFGKSYVTR